MALDEQRRARLVSALRVGGLDAVVTANPSAVLLLTGFWPVMGSSVAFFTADGTARIILPEDEQELAAASSGAHLTTYQPETLHRLTSPIEALEDSVGAVLSSLGLSRARLGVQLDQGVQPASYVVQTTFRDSLRSLLSRLAPHAQLTGCDALVEEQKASKTAVELTIMRRGTQIAADGFNNFTDYVAPGLREAEIAARIQSAFDTSPAAGGAERSYGSFFCMSGPNSATASAAYARTRQREVAAGDLVMIHANTCCDGFWTDITRTCTAGAPVERHNRMQTAILAARAAALQAIRPDARARDVDRAARDVMAAHGFGEAFRHGLGHGVGFAAANANALPRIHPESPDVLTEGMTFNIEPAAYFDAYGGMRHCDVVAVTPTGVEVLTDF